MSKGLYDKYTVVRNDTGEEVEDTFVLSPTKDPNARKAIKYYAKLVKGTQLSDDLLRWLQEFEEYKCKIGRVCCITESPVCCAHCRHREACYESCDKMCDLVRYQEVISIEECEFDD